VLCGDWENFGLLRGGPIRVRNFTVRGFQNAKGPRGSSPGPFSQMLLGSSRLYAADYYQPLGGV